VLTYDTDLGVRVLPEGWWVKEGKGNEIGPPPPQADIQNNKNAKLNQYIFT
jgi:hypothetical protein